VSVFCDQRMTAVVHPMCDFPLSAARFHSHFHGDNEDLYWRRAKFIRFPACSFELADMAKWSHTHNAQNSTGSCRMYLRCITPRPALNMFCFCDVTEGGNSHSEVLTAHVTCGGSSNHSWMSSSYQADDSLFCWSGTIATIEKNKCRNMLL